VGFGRDSKSIALTTSGVIPAGVEFSFSALRKYRVSIGHQHDKVCLYSSAQKRLGNGFGGHAVHAARQGALRLRPLTRLNWRLALSGKAPPV
jgi:hypothetical protein